MYDVIVIGSGPSGITAAIYAKRRNLSTLVISKGNGSLEKAEKMIIIMDLQTEYPEKNYMKMD